MINPKVTCLCCTYSRPILLGEAIKCFIDQDYNNKELIVLNDQVNVNLILPNCPSNIKIINLKKRFGSLGQKRNYIKNISKSDYYCIWDDDDLYTPWRISESVDFISKIKGYDIIKAKDAFLSVNNKDYKVTSNLFHSQAVITRNYMENNEYPDESVGEDAIFEKEAKVYSVDMLPNFWYIYRWGDCGVKGGIHHLSGIANSKESWNRSLTFESYRFDGDIIIDPVFKKDYWKDIDIAMNKINPIWSNEFKKKMKGFGYSL